MRTSAGACIRKYAGKVACAVAYQRHHFTVEGSQYQLSNLTVGNRFAGFRIDDFNQIAIFPKVHAVCSVHSKATPGPFISVMPKLL